MSAFITTDTLERMDASTQRPPGLSEYEARCSIRRLIEEHGEQKATWILSHFLEDEIARAKR